MGPPQSRSLLPGSLASAWAEESLQGAKGGMIQFKAPDNRVLNENQEAEGVSNGNPQAGVDQG